jgi:hypothetical protein
MSTWISRARRGSAPILSAAVLLAAAAAADGQADGPGRVAVSGGAVVIAAPSGFCADGAASRTSDRDAFVLFGVCDGARPALSGILTASVIAGGPADQPSAVVLPAMAAFFKSDAGRAALSRSGRARDVAIRDMRSVGPVLYILLRDRSSGPNGAVAPDYWRAVLLVKGRIVSLSVLGAAEAPPSPAAMRKLLDGFVARVRRANGLTG